MSNNGGWEFQNGYRLSEMHSLIAFLAMLRDLKLTEHIGINGRRNYLIRLREKRINGTI